MKIRSFVDKLRTNRQPAQRTKSAAVLLTAAEVDDKIIQYTGAAANLQLPTGTNLQLQFDDEDNDSQDFSVINTGTGTATLTTNTGLTLVGNMAVAINTSGMFRARRTSTATYTIFRIG